MRSPRARRGALLLPSLFTTGNLLLGFLAIVRGLEGRFEIAALLIFAAAVLDGIDGRLARFAGTDTDFGREFDSLADLSTFGLAPALLAHIWGLNELGRIGWLVPLFYVVCTATRLARFNVLPGDKKSSRFFVGLPSPAAGGTLASVLFIAPDNDWKEWLNVVLLVVVLALALLMVSSFRYASAKSLDPRRAWPVRTVLLVAAVLLVVAYHPPAFFVSAAAVYTCSGPAAWLRGKLVARRAGSMSADPEPRDP